MAPVCAISLILIAIPAEAGRCGADIGSILVGAKDFVLAFLAHTRDTILPLGDGIAERVCPSAAADAPLARDGEVATPPEQGEGEVVFETVHVVHHV